MCVQPASAGAAALLPIAIRIGQTQLAKNLGVAQAHVYYWLHGKRLPSARYRARIQDLYGVDWRSWDEPMSRRKKGAA